MIVGSTTSQSYRCACVNSHLHAKGTRKSRFGVRELSENGSASRVEILVRPYILYYSLLFKQTGVFLAFVRLQENLKRNTFLQTVFSKHC